jgi:predicted ATP-dependent endonuclease of OLD family
LQTYENKFVYDTIYSNRIIKDYEGIKKVFTGLEIFEGVKQKLLGDERDRSIIKEFEDFISENLFGEHVILIPKYGDDILNIKIGTEPQRSIVDLGDGLQALICILFPIFMEKDKEYFFFIEEPELNLHPLLQKKLVNLLSDDLFSKHQFFITTHSAHFINQKNSSVFNFYREGDKTLVGYLDNNQKIISALNNLGYKPSDLLQTNFIIWVEGPSDKIYITYLINKVAPELIENQHYTIMFYGGSSGKYLFEDDKSGDMILSLNRNCAFICDSDRDSKICTTQKHLNTTKLVTQLSKAGVYAWMTPYREFENHIDSDLFLEAVKNILNEPTAVLVENTEYSDKFVIKTNEKTNKSPKQNIRLTNKLYELIKKRDNKNKVHKIDLLILQEELQISIDQTINFTEQKVDKKVPIADYIVKKGFEPDKHLMKMVSELIVKIKAVNKI